MAFNSPIALLGLVCAVLGATSCGSEAKPRAKPPSKSSKIVRSKDLPPTETRRTAALTAQELRFRVFPKFIHLEDGKSADEARDAADATPGSGDAAAGGVLEPDPKTGLGIVPCVRDGSFLREASAEELAKLDSLGMSRAEIYRQNLARLMRKASLLSIGEPDGARFLYLDTALSGVEALVLLPEFWTKAADALGQEAMLALPDGGHCRFLPAGPTRLSVGMAQDLDTWHRDASRPLALGLIRREGERLVLVQSFADLHRASKRN